MNATPEPSPAKKRRDLRSVVLPDSVERPATRDAANGAAIPGEPQRAVVAEGGTIASALWYLVSMSARIPRTDTWVMEKKGEGATHGDPPVSSGVDHGVAAGEGAVGVYEVSDPVHHCGLREAVAGGCGAVFDV